MELRAAQSFSSNLWKEDRLTGCVRPLVGDQWHRVVDRKGSGRRRVVTASVA